MNKKEKQDTEMLLLNELIAVAEKHRDKMSVAGMLGTLEIMKNVILTTSTTD